MLPLEPPKVLRAPKHDPEKTQLKRQVKQLEEKVEARAERAGSSASWRRSSWSMNS